MILYVWSRRGGEETRVRDRWYPKGRRQQVVVWLGYAVTSLVTSVWSLLGNGRMWVGLLYLCMAVLGGAQSWNAMSRRVEADDRGVRVVAGLRARQIPWGEIGEIRTDARGVWATRMVVSKRDGEIVDLPMEPTETELMTRWHEATQE